MKLTESARKIYDTMRKLIKQVIAIAVSLHSKDLRKHGGHGNKIFLGKATANDLFILQPCVPSKGFPIKDWK